MAKKWPEKVVQRSFLKGHSFRNSLYYLPTLVSSSQGLKFDGVLKLDIRSMKN